MAITKRLNLDNIFLFLFLIIFPFGQIIRIGIVQPIDIVAGLAALYVILKNVPRPAAFKYLENFLFIAVASWVFSVFYFHQIEVMYGLLYLLRLFAYFYFLIYVWNFAKKSLENRKLLVNSLLIVSVASAVLVGSSFSGFQALKPFLHGVGMSTFSV